MTHHVLHIKASPNQIKKLKKGGKIRVKHAVKGTGVDVVVSPDTYSTATRNFDLGDGLEIQLSPTELQTNAEVAPQLQGQGIFGKHFDKFLDKHGVKKAAYAVGDAVKPMAKAAILAGLASGATALAGTETVATGGLGTAAVPAIYGSAASLGALANDYLDNPSKYQGSKQKVASNLKDAAKQSVVYDNINKELGTNHNYLAKSNLMNAVANNESAKITNGVYNTYTSGNEILPSTSPFDSAMGWGLHHHKHRREVSSIGGKGILPFAMQSQPFSANYQFRHTLPPQFAKYAKSGGGLFA